MATGGRKKPAAKPPPMEEVSETAGLSLLDEDTDISEQLFMSSDESDKAEQAADQRPRRPVRKSKRGLRVIWKEGVKPPSTKPTLVALCDAIKLSRDKLLFIVYRP